MFDKSVRAKGFLISNSFETDVIIYQRIKFNIFTQQVLFCVIMFCKQYEYTKIKVVERDWE